MERIRPIEKNEYGLRIFPNDVGSPLLKVGLGAQESPSGADSRNEDKRVEREMAP